MKNLNYILISKNTAMRQTILINYKFLIFISSLLIFSNIYSQTYPCNVNIEYKDNFKVQKSSEKMIYVKDDKSFILLGNLIRVVNASDSAISVRLSWVLDITNTEDQGLKGLYKVASSLSNDKNAKVTFAFLSADGGVTDVTLDITKYFPVKIDGNIITHSCYIDIPTDLLKTFTKKKLFGIDMPFYSENFQCKAKYQPVFIDDYKCCLKN